MKFGIDIDDTIADTYEIICVYAYEYTMNVLKREVKLNFCNCRQHDYSKTIFGWTDEESDKFWDLYLDKIFLNVKPFSLCSEYLSKLRNEGNEIIFITARYGESVERLTKEWLQKNNIIYDKLIVEAQYKGKVALENNIDIFIDDSLQNCIEVSNLGIKSFLMNTRTNGELETGEITRVYNWLDIYNKIHIEAKQICI